MPQRQAPPSAQTAPAARYCLSCSSGRLPAFHDAGPVLRPLPVQLIKPAFQLGVGTANLIHDAFGPIEVIPLSLQRPISRRARNDVSQIRDLVRELHKL